MRTGGVVQPAGCACGSPLPCGAGRAAGKSREGAPHGAAAGAAHPLSIRLVPCSRSGQVPLTGTYSIPGGARLSSLRSHCLHHTSSSEGCSGHWHTYKIARPAGPAGTVGTVFVRVISAVVLHVTLPGFRDATFVGTLPFVGLTLVMLCKRERLVISLEGVRNKSS